MKFHGLSSKDRDNREFLMKNIIFAVSFLLALSYFTLSRAQQASHRDIWETRKFFREQPVRGNQLFKRPPFFINAAAHQPIAKNNVNKSATASYKTRPSLIAMKIGSGSLRI